MAQYDFSALSDAALDQMLTDCALHLTRVLTGAQTATIGEGRSFSMARLPELQQLYNALSAEKRMRGLPGGDFILGSFGEPGGGDNVRYLGGDRVQ